MSQSILQIAIDMLGHRDVCGLSDTDPRRYSGFASAPCPLPKDVDVAVSPSPGRGRLKANQTMFIGVGLTLKRLSSKYNPQHWGPYNPELGLA